ncbi:DEAD/DEAH box helicase [Brevundimonas basaltis]|uniref:ATP-dependent RNA helicase DeaD n=1 Tax=Brevundimonas basaltis TaxID=472166 RepID=A0A7W8HWC5_9CAUL|nr:DEAD/DEAH box helicase [Brevundimonas basaltis]MBB5291141.1 ATP-dependent RNA helicase DeaD [Brevundimonas basaltis]
MPFPASHPALDRALSERGYAEPTPVQAAVLEAEDGRDLLVSAQTGSGKTVAFGLALATTLLGEDERFADNAAPVALVIAPTRELALQVSKELEWLYAKTGARIATCVGGMDPRAERRVLERGAALVVGTPGRLRDHLERSGLDLSQLKAVVLDEADEMLDMGFHEDLTYILDQAPAERRTLLFSATIAREIANLAKTYQRDAIRIDTTSKNMAHGDIEYRAIRVAPHEIEHGVVNVLRYFESPGALVFANTRERVKHLTASLRERGFSVVGLSGELTQSLRSEALQALRDGHARVCVATDVAARGLDLPDLGLVIHAEIPVNKATLLHRSGRTGRAGKKGVSVLMVSHTRRRKVELMLQSAAIKAEWQGPPSADEIRAKDHERMLTDPVLMAEADEESLAMGKELLARTSPEHVAAALIRLYREKLPPPEDVQDDERMKRAMASGVNERGQRDGPLVDFARGGEMSWFRVNIGRDKNADPKWLLPLICRLGHVTKRDVGSIKIFDRETKFEITKDAEAKFRVALTQPNDDGVTVQDAVAPAAGEKSLRKWDKPGGGDDRAPRGDKPFRKPRADGDGPKKPWAPRPDGDAAKKPWKAREDRPDGDRPKKPWTPRTDGDAAPAADAGEKKWVKRTKDGPTPEGKKPWVDKKGPKKPWTPRAEGSAAGDRPWTGKPKPGFKKPGGKPFKGKPDRG